MNTDNPRVSAFKGEILRIATGDQAKPAKWTESRRVPMLMAQPPRSTWDRLLIWLGIRPVRLAPGPGLVYRRWLPSERHPPEQQ